MIKKIVAIGPESTGKTELCKSLAEYFNTSWCEEYAREYLKQHGKKYHYNDLLQIAKGQIALEETATKQLIKSKNQLLFIDTDLHVIKIWGEYVFGKCDKFILEEIKKRKYDLYLLCNTDLPWVADELREYPDLITRQKLYEIYKQTLQNQPTPFLEISGKNQERLKQAIEAVKKILQKKKE